ncbi:J domain-containing protein [Caproiciproducens galactitolivorans]|uniref:Chaperone protein DnaJ n=1 Tax=Caproiciproducens galactitolivorans TaxID=642589 RepID=A0A4Z0XZW4_9FIRM|nr:J domain-containing protein [Caproiciproducens galactitolivorans]QEY33941.1 J domain-containing protein [Caproiciproducens galactitolivorans]TGJ76097.1 chaperone protein DnaJ [Caproiciproducens galactitolivorans]
MSDPYKVLGVSPNATDDEIKNAYRELAKKYHPDNYSGSPIADLAGEKMKEINEAYDTIIAQRKQQKNGGYSSYNTSNGGYTNPGYAYYSNTGFGDVRNLIMLGRIADAEQILDGVPPENRNAEWYFLKGTVLYKRGWLEEAYNCLARACQMDPGNGEYRAAMNQVMNQRNGAYGGYNPNVTYANGCSGCDICSSLLCADCCCECMGGDLIPCC